MNLPRGRGRITIEKGIAYLVARCPLCQQEHRYAKGTVDSPELAEIRLSGFADEWMPCQRDLPGNFWRIILSTSRQKPRPVAVSRGKRPGPP